jgi:hypothetical protein
VTAPALDGSATGIAAGTTTVSATLTTAAAGDVICVFAYTEQGFAIHPGLAVSSVTASGLTFAQRKRSHASQTGSAELWWAQASTALSAKTITVTYPSAFDSAAVIVFGVSGCDAAAPWDGNASLPAAGALNLTAGSGGSPALTASTTNADDLLLFLVATAANWSLPGTPPSGFTSIATAHEAAGASLWSNSNATAQAVSAVQSGITVTWGSVIPDYVVTSGNGSS